MAMTLIREGGMRRGRMLRVVLEPLLLASAAARVWHRGEEKDQVLGNPVLGVHPSLWRVAAVCVSVVLCVHAGLCLPHLILFFVGSKLLSFAVSPRSRQGR